MNSFSNITPPSDYKRLVVNHLGLYRERPTDPQQKLPPVPQLAAACSITRDTYTYTHTWPQLAACNSTDKLTYSYTAIDLQVTAADTRLSPSTTDTGDDRATPDQASQLALQRCDQPVQVCTEPATRQPTRVAAYNTTFET